MSRVCEVGGSSDGCGADWDTIGDAIVIESNSISVSTSVSEANFVNV